MKTAEIILHYLQLILSWPIVSLVLGIIFLKWFKNPISDFFRRFVRGEAYGVRIEASPPSEQRKEAKEVSYSSQDEFEKYIEKNPKKVIEEYSELLNRYQFERHFNIIFGTQIELLEYLSTKENDGDKYINLVVFYNNFTRLVKSVSTNSIKMEDYFGFLVDTHYIEFIGENRDSSIKITQQGLNFLSYIRTQYSSTYKYKPF